MKDFKIFFFSGFIMLIVFFAFSGFTAAHWDTEPHRSFTPGGLDPAIVEFLQYLIATVTGIAAVLLRKLIAKWLGPGWDEKKSSGKY